MDSQKIKFIKIEYFIQVLKIKLNKKSIPIPNIRIINCKINNCGTAIGGDCLNGIYINGLEMVNTGKFIESKTIENSIFDNINIIKEGEYMNKDMDYLINTKKIQNSSMTNLKVKTDEKIGIINSDEIIELNIDNVEYELTQPDYINDLIMLLSKEKLQDTSVLNDLQNLKKDPTLLQIISEKIKPIISYCDDSKTIQTAFELLTKFF